MNTTVAICEGKRLKGTEFNIISSNNDRIEVSFRSICDPSERGTTLPLSVDKRFILRSGISGFYCYAIYERLAGWPAFDLVQTRLVFKLRRELFHYMAITDEKQSIMPMPEDLSPRRCKVLALPESVLLTNPINPALKGEVVGQCMWGRGDGAEKGVLWLQKGLRGLETGLEGVRQIWAAVMTVTAWDEW
ncbi:hypothetical protein MRB53_005864 [Persea americana]|uniref:Uncharacterized protein n=1 Tax=Persea americana TaxID=3435 RepID=A0ACC2MEQ1_PERAE|nr:hypothetical protein MRB53_005864 [Persea americana]